MSRPSRKQNWRGKGVDFAPSVGRAFKGGRKCRTAWLEEKIYNQNLAMRRRASHFDRY
jgi:hypothetical protein